MCTHRELIGGTRSGGLADLVSVPLRCAHPVSDGLAADVVAADVGPVRALADRRVAEIASVLSSFTTEAAHLRGLYVFGADRIRSRNSIAVLTLR